MYPPHDPRKASPEYAKTHHHLVVELDEPCWICGIRNSDVQKIKDPAEKRKWQIETHHSELEWAAEKAFETDPAMLAKVVADLGGTQPQEYLASVVDDLHSRITGSDPAALREFLDGEGNMLILCALHHRGGGTGIHAITYPAWKLQRWQVPGGWQFVSPPNKTK
jgi:hypothetical protein